MGYLTLRQCLAGSFDSAVQDVQQVQEQDTRDSEVKIAFIIARKEIM